MKVNPEHFSANLEYYLKLRGMTQKELADKIGVSEPAITQYKKSGNIPDNRLPDIASALSVAVEDLLAPKTRDDYVVESLIDTKSDSIIDKLIDTKPTAIIDKLVRAVTLPCITERHPTIRFLSIVMIVVGLLLFLRFQSLLFTGLGALLAMIGLYLLNAFRKKPGKFYKAYSIIIFALIIISSLLAIWGCLTY